MKEHPILFSGEMVRAILGGRKTETRRVMKPQPWYVFDTLAGVKPYWRWHPRENHEGNLKSFQPEEFCPYGIAGDTLWVRETFSVVLDSDGDENGIYAYRADRNGAKLAFVFDPSGFAGELDGCNGHTGWKPSIFMPRWASRITLDVKDVHAERLQDMTDADAIAEGCESLEDFIMLWDKINAKRGFPFESNPWVWVVKFERRM